MSTLQDNFKVLLQTINGKINKNKNETDSKIQDNVNKITEMNTLVTTNQADISSTKKDLKKTKNDLNTHIMYDNIGFIQGRTEFNSYQGEASEAYKAYGFNLADYAALDWGNKTTEYSENFRITKDILKSARYLPFYLAYDQNEYGYYAHVENVVFDYMRSGLEEGKLVLYFNGGDYYTNIKITDITEEINGEEKTFANIIFTNTYTDIKNLQLCQLIPPESVSSGYSSDIESLYKGTFDMYKAFLSLETHVGGINIEGFPAIVKDECKYTVRHSSTGSGSSDYWFFQFLEFGIAYTELVDEGDPYKIRNKIFTFDSYYNTFSRVYNGDLTEDVITYSIEGMIYPKWSDAVYHGFLVFKKSDVPTSFENISSFTFDKMITSLDDLQENVEYVWIKQKQWTVREVNQVVNIPRLDITGRLIDPPEYDSFSWNYSVPKNDACFYKGQLVTLDPNRVTETNHMYNKMYYLEGQRDGSFKVKSSGLRDQNEFTYICNDIAISENQRAHNWWNSVKISDSASIDNYLLSDVSTMYSENLQFLIDSIWADFEVKGIVEVPYSKYLNKENYSEKYRNKENSTYVYPNTYYSGTYKRLLKVQVYSNASSLSFSYATSNDDVKDGIPYTWPRFEYIQWDPNIMFEDDKFTITSLDGQTVYTNANQIKAFGNGIYYLYAVINEEYQYDIAIINKHTNVGTHHKFYYYVPRQDLYGVISYWYTASHWVIENHQTWSGSEINYPVDLDTVSSTEGTYTYVQKCTITVDASGNKTPTYTWELENNS